MHYNQIRNTHVSKCYNRLQPVFSTSIVPQEKKNLNNEYQQNMLAYLCLTVITEGQYTLKKRILYTIYRYSQMFAQNIQYTYVLRILENIQNIIYFCLKKYIQYTFRIHLRRPRVLPIQSINISASRIIQLFELRSHRKVDILKLPLDFFPLFRKRTRDEVYCLFLVLYTMHRKKNVYQIQYACTF